MTPPCGLQISSMQMKANLKLHENISMFKTLPQCMWMMCWCSLKIFRLSWIPLQGKVMIWHPERKLHAGSKNIEDFSSSHLNADAESSSFHSALKCRLWSTLTLLVAVLQVHRSRVNCAWISFGDVRFVLDRVGCCSNFMRNHLLSPRQKPSVDENLNPFKMDRYFWCCCGGLTQKVGALMVSLGDLPLQVWWYYKS